MATGSIMTLYWYSLADSGVSEVNRFVLTSYFEYNYSAVNEGLMSLSML